MKQIHLSWLLVAAAVVAACEKERVQTEPVVENAPYVYSVKATISNGDETRTDYDADGKFSWTAGDQISVLFNDGKGDRFFTLTAQSGGATAEFSGTIDAGYNIGGTDGNIWALYPASEYHTYDSGTPTFYVQPSVDFTQTGFSANIPMYDLLTEEGAFSFKNLASTYKFTVKNLHANVNKVKFQIHNQTTYGLSGSWPIHADKYINYGYATPGSDKSTLTYISNVTNGQAVFYVSTRYWGTFQPKITISDAGHGDFVLKEFDAGSAKTPTSFTKVQQIALSVPTEPFIPAITIDGNFSDWDDCEAVYENSSNNYRSFKATYDKEFIYLYTKRVTVDGQRYIYYDFDLDNNPATGATEGGSRTGLEAYMALVLYSGNSIVENPGADAYYPNSSVYSGVVCKGTVGAEFTETELSIPRSNLNIQNGATIKIYSWGNKSADGVASHPLTLTIEN